MAESPAHKFGQIIGDCLEAAINPTLHEFADRHGLYLDRKGARPARSGSKVSWTDAYDNAHDLDYVLERGGTETRIGKPVAFIETAWRRYTKHSRNKAQEIQGAILPLRETYKYDAPFIGAILAGVFTEGALTQLKSLGFVIVYFSYDTVIQAFNRVGIDANFEEATPDGDLLRKVSAWNALSDEDRLLVARALVEINAEQIEEFMGMLERVVSRYVESIRILPLHGNVTELNSIEDAIAFIGKYDEKTDPTPLVKYEVQVLYNNGDRIEGHFAGKETAINFLRGFEGEVLQP